MEIVRAKNDQKIQWPNGFLFLLYGSRPHAAKGTFNNYVDQLLAKFNHLSLSSGQLCTFYIIHTLCSRDQAWNLYWLPTHLFSSK